jgi:large subunit ribosomal protein L17
MGHQDKVVKLGRTPAHRDAMLSNMAQSLFLHRVIRTTLAKAKALTPFVDRIITIAKLNTLASKRQVSVIVHQKEVFKKLYAEILPQLSDRNSGYSRIYKLGFRRGDAADMSVVELLVPAPVEVAPDKDAAKKGAKGVAATAPKLAAKAGAKKEAKTAKA